MKFIIKLITLLAVLNYIFSASCQDSCEDFHGRGKSKVPCDGHPGQGKYVVGCKNSAFCSDMPDGDCWDYCATCCDVSNGKLHWKTPASASCETLKKHSNINTGRRRLFVHRGKRHH